MNCWHRVTGILAIALITLAVPLRAGALDTARLAPAGAYADLGTHRLHYHCVGRGHPAVVIDAGIGGSGAEWRAVRQALVERTTVCTYDRAGYGWSDPGPSPRTTKRIARELRALLAAADVPPPYVLVGHSFGGFNVRMFAARHPTEVAGLVLVDSSHPDEPMPRAGAAGRTLNPLQDIPPPPAGAGDELAFAQYLNSRRKAVFAQMDEIAHFARSAGQVLGAGPLPDVPLIVLARDAGLGFADPVAEARWQRHQRELASLSARGSWRQVAGSAHDIHRARPAEVAAAIGKVLEEVLERTSAVPTDKGRKR